MSQSHENRDEGFVVLGTLRERETRRPLPGLVVRVFDRDWIWDDRVGFATSDADGRFEIRFGREAFRDAVESRPDLYLRIYDPDGSRLLLETRDAVRVNASQREVFELEIPARALDPTRRDT